MNKPQSLTIAIIASAVLISGSLVFVATGYNKDLIKTAVVEGLNEYVQAETQKQNAPEPQQVKPDSETISMEDLADDDAFKGEENAPVTIVEFSEFQCPYCGKYFNDAYPQIMEKYVETGKVKYVFRDFPLSFHAGAYPAALASECVRDQGGDEAYFEMHDRLFENQNVLGYDSDTLKSTLVSYAEALGADKGEFLECYENDTFKEEIYADMSYGQSIGISGTPSFIVNGELLVGAQPFEAFEQIIEAALAE